MMKPLLHTGPQGLGMILGFPVFPLSQALDASVFFHLGYFLQRPVFKSLDRWLSLVISAQQLRIKFQISASDSH